MVEEMSALNSGTDRNSFDITQQSLSQTIKMNQFLRDEGFASRSRLSMKIHDIMQRSELEAKQEAQDEFESEETDALNSMFNIDHEELNTIFEKWNS